VQKIIVIVQPLIIVVNKDYWKILSECRGHALHLSRLWQELCASELKTVCREHPKTNGILDDKYPKTNSV